MQLSERPLVLFDMDGTLLDTRHDIAKAANNARRELGLPLLSLEEVVRAVGDGVDLFVSRVTFPIEHERFAAAKKVFLHHYALNITGETRPYPGVIQMLDELQKAQIPMGIVSNKPANLVHEIVIHFGWQKYFKVWLGGDSAKRAKPSAAPLQLAVERSGFSREHPVVTVGDGIQDVMAAYAMQCRAIWVGWGFNSPLILPEGVEFLYETIHDPQGISDLLV